MIPTKPDVKANIHGLETQQFTIKVNNKSFRVLLDGLYTDKPQSIIRELWTNALDSHVAAGVADEPFHCQLPTYIDPTFTVRDYGTSMDHQTVMNVYTSLFDSDKEDTNEQTGCLGLGSKSPFSYTDAFDVFAYSGTEKRFYLAAMNDDGIPTITHLKSEPCGGPRGIEVRFPVQTLHVTDFQRAATKVAIGFDVRPTIVGGDVEPPDAIFEAETFRIMAPNSYIGSDRGYVRQGPVVYPIPYQFFHNLDEDVRYLIQDGHSFIVDVPIGSVEFTASREALQLTDATTKYLTTAVNEAFRDVRETALADIKEQDSYMNAYKSYNAWGEFLRLGDIEAHGRMIYANKTGLIPILNNGPIPKIMRSGSRGLSEVSWSSNGEIFFKIDDIPNMRFVIDSPAIKAPRKRKRFMEFAKKNKLAYWLHHPTGEEIIRLMRLLDLDRDQFMKVSDLDDVDPPERDTYSSSTGRSVASGLYSVALRPSSVGDFPITDRPSEIPEGTSYYWMPIDKAIASEQIYLEGLSYVRFDDRQNLKMFLRPLHAFGEYRPVYLMTPRAQKKYSPDDNDRLDVAFKAVIRDNAETICDMLEIPRSMDFGYNRYGRSIIEKMVASHDGFDEDLCSLVVRFKHTFKDLGFEDAVARREIVVTDIKAKYPMVFNPDDHDVKQYIELIDFLEEANNNKEDGN